MSTPIDELVALLGYDIQGEEELKRFNRSLDTLESKAMAVGAALVNMAAVAGAAVAGGMAILGAGVIQTSAKFESYAATLETIEGSAEKAQNALDWITDFAKTTPYEVDELTAAFVKLRSYGMDPMNGMMTVLGDTASGMGKSLDQVVEAMADASTFQFERLRELGIVASQAGDQVTFSWTENGKSMSKTIKKTSDEVTKFLTDVWGKKFGGAMIRQSKTWNGMLSNLGDSWTAFQLKIGEAGFFEAAKNKLADFMDQLSALEDDGTIDNISTFLSSVFVSALDLLGGAIERVSRHLKFFMENWESLAPWVKGIGAILLAAAMTTYPVLAVFAGIALAVDDLLTYLEGGESVIGNFVKWLRTLIPASAETQDAILKLGAAIAGGLLLAFTVAPRAMIGAVTGGISALFAMIGGSLITKVKALGPKLMAAFAPLRGYILRGLAMAFGVLTGPVGWAIMAASALALIYTFWDQIVAGWNWVASQAAPLFATMGNWFSSIDWAGAVQALYARLTSALSSGWAAVTAQAKNLFAGAKNWLSGVDWGQAGYNVGRFIMSAIANAIASFVYVVIEAVKKIIPAVLAVDWVGLGRNVVDTLVSSVSGSPDWDAIGESIRAAVESALSTLSAFVVGVFRGMADAVQAAVKDWFNIDLYAIGVQLVNRLWEGMKSIGGQIKAWVKDLFTFDLPFGLGGTGNVGANDNMPSNLEANLARTDGAAAKAGVVQDNSTRSVTTNIDAPVTVQVQQASQAPAAVGGAISKNVKSLQPARMNGGGGF